MAVSCCVLALMLLSPALSAQDAFPADRLMEVRLWMAPADWDDLRRQPRPPASVYCGDCLAKPARHPFTVFPARLEIDGEIFERVGVRKRGLVDSVDSERPALKIDLRRFGKGRLFRGLRRISLSNAKADPALVRQCLSLRLFAAAGLPAPRCSFVRLRVNDLDLGPYVHVETVDRRFLRRYPDLAEGALVRGTISDFRRAWLGAFLCKSGCDDDVKGRLAALAEVLEKAGSLTADSLASLLDLDAYLDHWALESLLLHQDGYSGNANNFFVAFDRQGRMVLIPWGLDDGFPFFMSDQRLPHVIVGAMLPWRLVREDALRARLEQRIEAMLDKVWNEDELAREAMRMFSLVYPALPEARRGRALEELEDVIDFVCARRSQYQEAAQFGWSDEGPLQETPCESCPSPSVRP
ncbi:MAG: hypothetical protein GYA21_17795 [Myxococcales bacterium]|nr:hypothetical protein [Myxococcales bacterium]